MNTCEEPTLRLDSKLAAQAWHKHNQVLIFEDTGYAFCGTLRISALRYLDISFLQYVNTAGM